MSRTAGGARILVVEDEPGIVRAVKANLAGHGFHVETATTGADGVAAFDRRRPDLVILDLGLPDIDGTEVIRHVRSQGDTPVIVLPCCKIWATLPEKEPLECRADHPRGLARGQYKIVLDDYNARGRVRFHVVGFSR